MQFKIYNLKKVVIIIGLIAHLLFLLQILIFRIILTILLHKIISTIILYLQLRKMLVKTVYKPQHPVYIDLSLQLQIILLQYKSYHTLITY